MAGEGVCMVRGGMHGRRHVWLGVVHGRGMCMAGKMAIAVGSTHPTGMHSCVYIFKKSALSSFSELNAIDSVEYCFSRLNFENENH